MIRRTTAADVDELAALYERSYATLTFLPTLHTLAEHRDHFGRVVAEQEVWAWEEDGRILGFAALGGEMLNYLYIEPEAIGRGIGTALYRHALAQRPSGFTFWVFQQNERARRIYLHQGDS